MEALLIIDVQNDFCPGGALPVPGGHEVIPVCNALSEAFEHVLLTQDWHPEGHLSFASAHAGKLPLEIVEFPYGTQVLWPDHCIQGSRGAAFHPDLEIDRAQLIVRKGFRKPIDSYSAFFENDRNTSTGLAGYLKDRGITKLFLAGLALDFCVGWSAVDGRRMGFEVSVIEDATRGIDAGGSLEAAMRQMHEAGVQMASADYVLNGLAG